jgi:hypothetical protein
MKQKKKMRRFERNETGYHNQAVKVLARWVKGKREKPFYIEDSIAFIPDVSCYDNGVLSCLYEVVYSHPLIGRKLAMIEYWCYRNATDLVVREISADYILKQTGKPDVLQLMETYIINPYGSNNL